jgi:hypothetical protein
MTPKEKAFELVDKIYQWFPLEYYVIKQDLDVMIEYNGWENAKQCTLIYINEIIIMPKIASFRRDEVYMELEFWQEVKQEIEKL